MFWSRYSHHCITLAFLGSVSTRRLMACCKCCNISRASCMDCCCIRRDSWLKALLRRALEASSSTLPATSMASPPKRERICKKETPLLGRSCMSSCSSAASLAKGSSPAACVCLQEVTLLGDMSSPGSLSEISVNTWGAGAGAADAPSGLQVWYCTGSAPAAVSKTPSMYWSSLDSWWCLWCPCLWDPVYWVRLSRAGGSATGAGSAAGAGSACFGAAASESNWARGSGSAAFAALVGLAGAAASGVSNWAKGSASAAGVALCSGLAGGSCLSN
mmetsp:Transcript_23884/g.52670  ORF Transcript_23884/g.52670 Transcript_23884/m.52670 type:complete len:274 (+) Transcript_23884:702-1523(+)